MFWFTILCSDFQYTVTWVPNLCTAVHGNVYVHVHSVDMFVKTRAMSCYKFGSLWWRDTCNVGTLWLGTKGVRWRQVLLYMWNKLSIVHTIFTQWSYTLCRCFHNFVASVWMANMKLGYLKLRNKPNMYSPNMQPELKRHLDKLFQYLRYSVRMNSLLFH